MTGSNRRKSKKKGKNPKYRKPKATLERRWGGQGGRKGKWESNMGRNSQSAKKEPFPYRERWEKQKKTSITKKKDEKGKTWGKRGELLK